MAPLSWWQKGYNLLVEIQTLHRMNRFREAEMKVRKEDRARGRTLHDEEPGRGQSVKKKRKNCGKEVYLRKQRRKRCNCSPGCRIIFFVPRVPIPRKQEQKIEAEGLDNLCQSFKLKNKVHFQFANLHYLPQALLRCGTKQLNY